MRLACLWRARRVRNDLLRTETERGTYHLSSSGVLSVGFLVGLA
jgi:hypothetical protein